VIYPHFSTKPGYTGTTSLEKSMKKILMVFIALSFSEALFCHTPDKPCSGWFKWAEKACLRVHNIWNDGDVDLYLGGYTWHNRYMYDHERVKHYNEQAWGTGLGKSIYDEDGDLQGLYAFAFLDSHKNIEPVAGYVFVKTAHLRNKLNAGAGFSVLATARPDIFHNIPFPGAVPVLSVGYDRLTVFAAYVPGSRDAGNVLFVYGKIRFDKL